MCVRRMPTLEWTASCRHTKHSAGRPEAVDAMQIEDAVLKQQQQQGGQGHTQQAISKHAQQPATNGRKGSRDPRAVPRPTPYPAVAEAAAAHAALPDLDKPGASAAAAVSKHTSGVAKLQPMSSSGRPGSSDSAGADTGLGAGAPHAVRGAAATAVAAASAPVQQPQQRKLQRIGAAAAAADSSVPNARSMAKTAAAAVNARAKPNAAAAPTQLSLAQLAAALEADPKLPNIDRKKVALLKRFAQQMHGRQIDAAAVQVSQLLRTSTLHAQFAHLLFVKKLAASTVRGYARDLQWLLARPEVETCLTPQQLEAVDNKLATLIRALKGVRNNEALRQLLADSAQGSTAVVDNQQDAVGLPMLLLPPPPQQQFAYNTMRQQNQTSQLQQQGRHPVLLGMWLCQRHCVVCAQVGGTLSCCFGSRRSGGCTKGRGL